MKYIALLRGINVGGNKKVPMAELKKALESLDFTSVKTLLNSGNVIFDADNNDIETLTKKVTDQLEQTFGWRIDTLFLQQYKLQKMVKENPFKDVSVTPQTRLYVTFLFEKQDSTLKIPYESPEKKFKILQVTDEAIFSVLTLSEQYNTTDAMKIIGKEYGTKVTTRNWNTVVKLAAL